MGCHSKGSRTYTTKSRNTTGGGAGGKQSKKLVEVTQETKALALLEASNSKENIAVIGKNGGWVYFRNPYGTMFRYSIDSNGRYKNEGKTYKTDHTQLQNSLAAATNYAIFEKDANFKKEMLKPVKPAVTVKSGVADFEKQIRKLNKAKTEKSAKKILNNLQSTFEKWKSKKTGDKLGKYDQLVGLTESSFMGAKNTYREKFGK